MAVRDLFGLYQTVLHQEWRHCNGNENIESHIEMVMNYLLYSYSVEGLKTADSLNFNQVELRCAYIHLFSTSHSHMVIDALERYHELGACELKDLIYSEKQAQGTFDITSLGGGPGSDTLGILMFLKNYGYLHDNGPPVCVRVVDEYQKWESPFRNLMRRFHSSEYPIQRVDFTTQDLLQPLTPEVVKALRQTDLVSMVKFVSAISGDSRGTRETLARVFRQLQKGTLVLIIDNAGGPDFKRALEVAHDSGLEPVLGPEQHVKFRVPRDLEPRIGVPDFGKHAQASSTISMVILVKFNDCVHSDITVGHFMNRGSGQIRNNSSLPNGDQGTKVPAKTKTGRAVPAWTPHGAAVPPMARTPSDQKGSILSSREWPSLKQTPDHPFFRTYTPVSEVLPASPQQLPQPRAQRPSTRSSASQGFNSISNMVVSNHRVQVVNGSYSTLRTTTTSSPRVHAPSRNGFYTASALGHQSSPPLITNTNSRAPRTKSFFETLRLYFCCCCDPDDIV